MTANYIMCSNLMSYLLFIYFRQPFKVAPLEPPVAPLEPPVEQPINPTKQQGPTNFPRYELKDK